ncbi:hypothetical protein JCM31826_01400 [Thermaurantimonas aggregans]|uniref:Uncharacterized protein n=1 Tax=Thermaurantimonas aggregans TaxID=2173829 RepID=A0A401XI39_9FLAO|nr:hypothetical protein [Thermaurantimonas aggregans]MCX8149216.1 hypothetical protein [Thermaurantimonas aggregans]GCD76658.1 hypothetical protein JCM31826_01400 [Thermaurantimonas aggregans]
MFDSREYEFSDITLILGGRDVTGVRGIKYTVKQEKELVYGKGKEPLKIQSGNKSYEGELTLLQSELEALIAVSPDKSILSLQLDAVVAYGNPSQGDVMITDVLQGIQFTEETKESKTGDKFLEIRLPFIFLRKKAQYS